LEKNSKKQAVTSPEQDERNKILNLADIFKFDVDLVASVFYEKNKNFLETRKYLEMLCFT
jgi:hypothetical protein